MGGEETGRVGHIFDFPEEKNALSVVYNSHVFC